MDLLLSLRSKSVFPTDGEVAPGHTRPDIRT
jgi:hypothetical protein